MRDSLARALGTTVTRAVRLPGGASKEAWAVDTVDGRHLLVRRAGGGVMHADALSLAQEFEVLVAAREAGVRVPEPLAYLGDVAGREAFAMERVRGETIGRRIVRSPPPGLELELAGELAGIHAIAQLRVPFLPRPCLLERLEEELDAIDEPHPAIELGLAWCRERLPLERPRVVCHGDFRIGNVAVDEGGLVAVLDWEFARVSDPAEDLAWPLVRAWRFGADTRRLGGIAGAEAYLARYAELTGREIPPDELYAWEVLGNCKWAIAALAQARRHLRGEERNVELAILGRLAAETEHELLRLIEPSWRPRRRRRAASPADPAAVGASPSVGAAARDSGHDRPTAGELAIAVREFLEAELLPVLDDHRLRFRTLVAMNALAIAAREAPPPQERDWAAARRIRAGAEAPGELAAQLEQVEAKLRVASPAYLERTPPS